MNHFLYDGSYGFNDRRHGLRGSRFPISSRRSNRLILLYHRLGSREDDCRFPFFLVPVSLLISRAMWLHLDFASTPM
jgi:hypothetical protein